MTFTWPIFPKLALSQQFLKKFQTSSQKSDKRFNQRQKNRKVGGGWIFYGLHTRHFYIVKSPNIRNSVWKYVIIVSKTYLGTDSCFSPYMRSLSGICEFYLRLWSYAPWRWLQTKGRTRLSVLSRIRETDPLKINQWKFFPLQCFPILNVPSLRTVITLEWVISCEYVCGALVGWYWKVNTKLLEDKPRYSKINQRTWR